MEEKGNEKEENKEAVPLINEKQIKSQAQDDAEPSSSTPLPGAIHTPRIPGLSKSEHSICKITTKDVTNALKSISFGTTPPVVKINFRELNIPILDKEVCPSKDDSATLVDLKKFMASCFTFNKDNIGNAIKRENPNVHAISNVAIDSNVTTTANVEASTHINIPNEVIVTNGTEGKLTKVGTDKKKTSGSISEKSDSCLAQRDSLSSIGSNVCRICMTRGRERLISPCNCKGSLANVHLSCLERWLNQVGRNHCELCGYSYPAIRTPRYTVLQALRLWFGNPRNRSHLQSDCLIFWLLSTVTAGLLAVCIVGTQYFVIEGNKFGKLDATARKEEGISHRITETAMDFFMAIVLCGYSVTVYLLWKDHYVMWNRWRRANVNVRLLLTSDARPFTPPRRYIV